MIKECSGCDSPAVGKYEVGTGEELACAECMKALIADGNTVSFLEPRMDLVERVKAAIKSKFYEEATVEGSLALNLTVDKLVQQQRQRDALPKCAWSGQACELRGCAGGVCYLDGRYAEITRLDPAPLCGAKAIPDRNDSLLCDMPAGHDGLHARGWGPMAVRWGNGECATEKRSDACPGCGFEGCPPDRCLYGKRTG